MTAAISHEPRWFVARGLEVEVTSQGDTVEEALANLREVLELYFEDQPFPSLVEPLIIAPVDNPGVTPALPVISGREAIGALKRAGYSQASQKGSHVKLRSHDGRTVIVPLHRELAGGTLASKTPHFPSSESCEWRSVNP